MAQPLARYGRPVKRSLHLLLHILTTFSLLVSLATTFFWARSNWKCDHLSVSGGLNQLASDRGVIRLDLNRRIPITGPVFWVSTKSSDGWKNDGGYFGFLYYRGTGSQTGRHLFQLPHWFLIIFFSILPVRQFMQRRPVPPPAGMCIKCGYDLRATPDRCPECGTVPQKAQVKSETRDPISERGHH